MGIEWRDIAKPENKATNPYQPGILSPILLIIVGVALVTFADILLRGRVFFWLPGWLADIFAVLLPFLVIAGVLAYLLQWQRQRYHQNQKENQQLREQINQYGQVINRLQDATMIMDLHNQILVWNQSAAELYGLPAENALGKPIDLLLGMTSQTRAQEQAMFETALKTGTFDGEREQLNHAGNPQWISTHITLVRGALDQPLYLLRIDRDITHHKQAELSTLETNQQFHNIFYKNHAVMLLINPTSGSLVDVNEAACQFYGYSREVLLTKYHIDICTMPADESSQHLRQVIENGWDHYYTQHRLASGEIRDVEVYSAHYFSDGQMMILPIILDVTEKRKTALALQEAERRLWELLENVRLLAAMVDRQGKITFANDYMTALCGWPKEDVIGAAWNDFVPADVLDDYRAVFQRVTAGGESSSHIELPILTRQGERKFIAFNIIPLRNISGEINGVAALGADITGRALAEQDVERRMKEMATLQQAGRFIITKPNMQDALAGTVSAARLLLGSQTAMILLHDHIQQELELAAFDGDPLLAKAASRQPGPMAIGDRIPDMTGVVGWVLHQRQPVLVGDLRNAIGFELDPNIPPQSLIAVPMIYQNEIVGVFEVNNSTVGAFSSRDLPVLSMLADFATVVVINSRFIETEQKQRRLLEESQNRLIQSEKMNAMGRMVATLAHEINNPLQSLRSGISLLREQSLSEEKTQAYLDVAYREVERLNRTVNQVLGFYRSPDQQQIPVNLRQILDETLSLVGKQLEHSNITVCCDFAANLPQVTGYPDQLRQVFLNLFLNAAASMPRGGQLTLKIDQDADAGEVRIAVQDNGEGIAPDDLPNIFKPFYTTRKDGSGLGLSISQNLVEKHRGRIEVTSLPQQGSTFTVILPVHPGALSTSEATAGAS